MTGVPASFRRPAPGRSPGWRCRRRPLPPRLEPRQSLPAVGAALLLAALLAPHGAAGAAAGKQPPAAAAPPPAASGVTGAAAAAPAAGQEQPYRLEINGGLPLFSQVPEVTVAGSTDAPAGSTVEVTVTASTVPAPSVAGAPPSAASAAAPAQ